MVTGRHIVDRLHVARVRRPADQLDRPFKRFEMRLRRRYARLGLDRALYALGDFVSLLNREVGGKLEVQRYVALVASFEDGDVVGLPDQRLRKRGSEDL